MQSTTIHVNSPDPLAQCRQDIDRIDGVLVALLRERTRLTMQAGEIKLANGEPVHASDDQGPGTRRAETLAAYQGARGAYSETAAWALLGPEAPLLPCVTLRDVFDAVATGRAGRAVVPVENTLSGAVPDAAELLVAHDVAVTGETIVQIDHVLAARPGLQLADVRRVLSHPVALAQCTRFFHDNPAITAVPVFDTAGAVPLALAAEDDATAAIASRRAATLHGAQVLAEAFQDHSENWTRFLLVVPASDRVAPAEWPHKAMIACRLRHEPGALARALEPVAARSLNLTRIESRPIHGRPFEYQFLLELQADRAGQDLQPAIEDLAREASWLRVLGVFRPAARLT